MEGSGLAKQSRASDVSMTYQPSSQSTEMPSEGEWAARSEIKIMQPSQLRPLKESSGVTEGRLRNRPAKLMLLPAH